MPKPPARPILSPSGHALTRNPARIEFAAEQLRTLSYKEAVKAIVERWGIHPATAKGDLAAAKRLIALELDGLEVRAAEVARNERIANKAEDLADRAAAVAVSGTAADYGAVAALHRTAIAASREVSRLTGAYAPKQIEVKHSGTVEVALQIDAVLAILDERGRAAFRLIQEQIEAARADGRLALAAPEDEEPDPGAN